MTDFAKEARDLAKQPYSADEQRVADYLAEVSFGGGDDPVGYIITAHRWAMKVSIPNAKEAGLAEGLTRAAEIAHELGAAIVEAEIREAILSASPPAGEQ